MPASVHAIGDVHKRVAAQFDAAIAAGDAFFFESSRNVVSDTSTGTQLDLVVTCVPALAEKSKAKANASQNGEADAGSKTRGEGEGKETRPQQSKGDVFAPPYVPNLLVKELDDFVLLLNKYAVLPKHFLLVTKDFVSQDLPPSPRMLALAYRIILAYPSSPKSELMAFYNCGPSSGASQPHQHVQFIAVSRSGKASGGAGAGAGEGDDEEDEDEDKANIPIEALLDRIERDGKEDEHVHALPLPYQHYVRLIQPPKVGPASAPREQQEAKLAALEGYMASRLLSLIDAQFQSRRVAKEEDDDEDEDKAQSAGPTEPPPPSKPSFNLLLSKRAFHLIPRKRGEVTIPLPPAPQAKEASDEKAEISVNALGYAGLLLARSPDEVEAIKSVEGGVLGILSRAGRKPVPDDSWQTA